MLKLKTSLLNIMCFFQNLFPDPLIKNMAVHCGMECGNVFATLSLMIWNVVKPWKRANATARTCFPSVNSSNCSSGLAVLLSPGDRIK